MKRRFIIGIDLGGTNLKVALLDLELNIKNKESLNTRSFSRKEELIAAIADSVLSIITRSNLTKKDILGVGLGLPGPVDSYLGVVHFLPNIPGWREVNLKKILEKKIGLKVFIDNDAKIMTLAEYRLGNAKGFSNVLCVTLGTGVGGGIILGSKLYRGQDNAAGEIGHLPLNETGVRCNCGGVSCLEAYVGNNRILEKARKIFKRNISLEELSVLADKGNKKALDIWRKVGGHLGVALSAVVNLLNLDAIVIGGGVANAGKILFDRINLTIKQRAMSVQGTRVKVFKAMLGNNAGMIGAAILVKEAQPFVNEQRSIKKRGRAG